MSLRIISIASHHADQADAGLGLWSSGLGLTDMSAVCVFVCRVQESVAERKSGVQLQCSIAKYSQSTWGQFSRRSRTGLPSAKTSASQRCIDSAYNTTLFKELRSSSSNSTQLPIWGPHSVRLPSVGLPAASDRKIPRAHKEISFDIMAKPVATLVQRSGLVDFAE